MGANQYLCNCFRGYDVGHVQFTPLKKTSQIQYISNEKLALAFLIIISTKILELKKNYRRGT